jgi:DNA-binding response OmpR family regulator
MPANRAEPQFVRFGDFALDLRSGELSKNGSRLLLPVQPFRILALLVRSPGTLVTRDDLRHELWRAMSSWISSRAVSADILHLPARVVVTAVDRVVSRAYGEPGGRIVTLFVHSS